MIRWNENLYNVAEGVRMMPSRPPVGFALSLQCQNKVPFSANVVPEAAVAPYQHDSGRAALALFLSALRHYHKHVTSVSGHGGKITPQLFIVENVHI